MSNGYVQERPYKIYVMGPDYNTCELFQRGVQCHILNLGNTRGDRVETAVRGNLVVSNSFSVLHQRREPGDPILRYEMTLDTTPVRVDTKGIFADNIDAYVLILRIDSADDFRELVPVQMKRVLDLCERQFTGPQKVIFVVAHRPNMYLRAQGFSAAAMSDLLRYSHAVYRYANFNNTADCANVIDLVVKQTLDAHSKYQLRENSALGSATVSWGAMLAGWSRNLMEWPQRIFPRCDPGPETFDEPRPMSDEERALHCPKMSGNGSRFTPMGEVV